ncbi:hypothetical protein AABB24_019391, partial [Solanum stoloniferum]
PKPKTNSFSSLKKSSSRSSADESLPPQIRRTQPSPVVPLAVETFASHWRHHREKQPGIAALSLLPLLASRRDLPSLRLLFSFLLSAQRCLPASLLPSLFRQQQQEAATAASDPNSDNNTNKFRRIPSSFLLDIAAGEEDNINSSCDGE